MKYNHIFSENSEEGTIYAINEVGDMFMYRDVAPQALNQVPRQKQAVKIGTGFNYRHMFSGGNGIIYAVNDAGKLDYFKFDGIKPDGTIHWEKEGVKREIGSDFFFKQMVSIASGVLLGFKEDGNIFYYRLLRFKPDGTPEWENGGQGKKAGRDFHYKHYLSDGNNIIYAIDEIGDLYYYRFMGFDANGVPFWENALHPIVIGNSFDFLHLFSGKDGVVYGVNKNGQLFWYKDLGRNGSKNWANDGRGVLVFESLGYTPRKTPVSLLILESKKVLSVEIEPTRFTNSQQYDGNARGLACDKNNLYLAHGNFVEKYRMSSNAVFDCQFTKEGYTNLCSTEGILGGCKGLLEHLREVINNPYLELYNYFYGLLSDIAYYDRILFLTIPSMRPEAKNLLVSMDTNFNVIAYQELPDSISPHILSMNQNDGFLYMRLISQPTRIITINMKNHNDRFLSGSNWGDILAFDNRIGEMEIQFYDHSHNPYSIGSMNGLCFTNTGHIYMTKAEPEYPGNTSSFSWNSFLFVFDATTGELLDQVPLHYEAPHPHVAGVSYHPSGAICLAWSNYNGYFNVSAYRYPANWNYLL